MNQVASRVCWELNLAQFCHPDGEPDTTRQRYHVWQHEMLNHSVSQLRQVKVLNLSLSKQQRKRRTSSSASAYSPTLDRPSPLRRRSTRISQAPEHPLSRFQRYEHAVANSHVTSFFVASIANEVLYISETSAELSPTFKPFKIDVRARSLRITVYAKLERWQQLCRLDCNLSQMKCLGQAPESAARNTVLLKFEDAKWYCEYSKLDSPTNEYITPRIESYTFNQLMRLQSSTEYINDSLQSIQRLKEEANRLLFDANARLAKISELDMVKYKCNELAKSVTDQRKSLQRDRTKVHKLRTSIAAKRLINRKASDQTRSCVTNKCIDTTSQVMSSEIRRVQRTIVTTLATLYPIEINDMQASIRGLQAAEKSEYITFNPAEAAVLGYIGHLVVLLAHYLDISLRYPIKCASSTSFILDPISVFPDTSDYSGSGPPFSLKRDRKYPLHWVKGSPERYRYGVYLLNKNIEQLLQGRGLVCGDVRDTLHNLAGLVFWVTTINEDEDVGLLSTDEPVPGLLGALEIRDNDDLLLIETNARLNKRGKSKLREIQEDREKDCT